ncbi:MAG: hypothetical protein ACE5D6_02440 [Candidatus Zixiibacteriota bacterium]
MYYIQRILVAILLISLIFAISSSAWAGDYDVENVSADSTLIFYPGDLFSTGHVQKFEIPSVTYQKLNGIHMFAGKKVWVEISHHYRAFAEFNISSPPSGSCITSVQLMAFCTDTSTSASHTLLVHPLDADPSTLTAEYLYNIMDTADTYASCPNCMTSLGLHTVTLDAQAITDFLLALNQGWFAVGFSEDGDDDDRGSWDGFGSNNKIRLAVQISFIPSSPGTPLAIPSPVCVDSQYCINWNQSSNATYYEVKENDGPWVDVGNVTEVCYTKSTPGEYTYYVQAWSPCGSAGTAEGVTVSVTPCSCCTGITGNVDGSGDNQIDIADIVYFIDYSFNLPPGPAPPCMEEADVNGDSVIDIEDIVYLIDYAFNLPSGPEPVACP